MDIEKEIEQIRKRNLRVEADKAWEVSWIRRGLVAILTYFVVVVFFYFAGLPDPFVNSIMTALAFILSTLTLQALKRVWIKKFYKK